MKNPAIQKDRILDFLNGDVKKVVQKKYTVSDDEEVLKEFRTREYTFDGKRIKTINYDDNGSVKLEQISNFNPRGFKIGFSNYNKYGELDSEGQYDIDLKGNIIRKYFNGQLEEEMVFDNENNLIEHHYCHSDDTSMFYYDSERKFIIEQINYQRGQKSHILKYINDLKGNVIQIKTYRSSSEELLHTQIFNYNVVGDVIESYVILKNEEKVNWYKHEYIYDSKENWINKITRGITSDIIQKEVREIDYYLSEITSEPLIKKDQIKLLVSNFENVDDFLVKMKERGYDFNVYLSSDNPQSTSAFNEHEVIWLGHLVPLDDIKAVVKLSKTIYPHLKYVKVFYEDICHDEIYIGGSTSSALEIYYCSPLSDNEFEIIQNFKQIEDLHRYIDGFSNE